MKKSILLYVIKRVALMSVCAFTLSACVSCGGGEETAPSSSTLESSKPAFTVRDDNNPTGESGLEEGKYTDGEFVYYISNNNATVIDYIGNKKQVEISSSVDDIPVTSIGDNAFADISTIESIKVPSSVANIGNFAFSYCTGLKSIELPLDLVTLGSYAFNHCSSLESCVIPDSVSNLPQSVFYYCSSLKQVSLPKYLGGIPKETFFYCTSLEEFTMPEFATGVGDYAFTGCSALKKINCGENLGTIGKESFRYCTAIQTLDFSKCKSIGIGSKSFANCTSLKKVIYPNEKGASGDAFMGCEGIEYVNG